MLSPDEFNTDQPLPLFEIEVDNLRLAGEDIGAVTVPVSYDHSWNPVFDLSAFATFERVISNDWSASIRFKASSTDSELIISRLQTSTDQQSATLEAKLKHVPAILCSSEKGHGFKAIVLSPPNFLRKPIILKGAESLVFEINHFFNIRHNACLLTSNLKFNAREPLAPLSNLIEFLTFVKGSLCGVGNVQAFAPDGSTAFSLLGFTRNDDGKRETNWFDYEVQGDLPEIFGLFAVASTDPKTRLALRQTIGFYRASNVSRHLSLEMAIIAAHSALEAVVNFILESRAGWSRNLMKERAITFSDRMRAATANVGLKVDPSDPFPELKKIVTARNLDDVYMLISFCRNKLVHQDQNFRFEGLRLHETWLVMQWLVEVLVFGVIGYRGKMIDRRAYSGWRGMTIEIPLPA
jgi:hypothetical protein